jgi:hypothetical protein
MTSRIEATMVENGFEHMSSGNPQPVAGISRRELLKRGGEVSAAAAVPSVFSPFVFTGKAAATKKLSFWQFYAPRSSNESKWFEDSVIGLRGSRVIAAFNSELLFQSCPGGDP